MNTVAKIQRTKKVSPLRRNIYKHRMYYLMLIPCFAYFICFRYLPIYGISIAFQDFRPARGFLGSEWVGLYHFQRAFESGTLASVFTNTLLISTLNILFFFPIPIILALMLNEVSNMKFKKFVQSSVYMPYFVSWVVVVSIVTLLLNERDGLVNILLDSLGYDKVRFMTSTQWFRPLIVLEMIWRESGYGTVIFLAALAGIDPSLYEAATIDGANRWQKLLHITLTGIKSTIVVMLLLRLGMFFELGFDQIFLQLNAMNRPVGEIFNTYIYRVGLQNGDFSYTTALGLFKSITGLILVVSANFIAKMFGEEGIF